MDAHSLQFWFPLSLPSSHLSPDDICIWYNEGATPSLIIIAISISCVLSSWTFPAGLFEMESKVKSARIHKMIQFYHSNENIQTILKKPKAHYALPSVWLCPRVVLVFWRYIRKLFVLWFFQFFLTRGQGAFKTVLPDFVADSIFFCLNKNHFGTKIYFD